MKFLLVCLLTVVFSAEAQTQHVEDPISDNETVLIFTRHAEKLQSDDNDPSLNEEGKKRALKLVTLLRNYDVVDKIYSTSYKRTMETAQPTANLYELPIRTYDAKDLDAFATRLLENHMGETVLIVGHSNTTPELINHVMGNNDLEKFDEDDYSNMYIIRIEEGKEPTIKHYVY